MLNREFSPPRNFFLNRIEDESGVSGTGPVAEGSVYWNGKATLVWRTETSSVAVYDSIEHLLKVHGHGGKTQLEWFN